MEQQGPAGGAEGQVAQFVQDHEVELGHCFGDLAGLALGLFLFEGVDQFDGREEADFSTMMFDGLNAKGRRDMGFAGARQANDILPAVPDLRFGFGIRFTLGLERLCKLPRRRSMVGPPI